MLTVYHLVLKSHALGIVFRKPRLRGVSVGEDLEVIRVCDPLARIHSTVILTLGFAAGHRLVPRSRWTFQPTGPCASPLPRDCTPLLGLGRLPARTAPDPLAGPVSSKSLRNHTGQY
jgi:hypothetical protein